MKNKYYDAKIVWFDALKNEGEIFVPSLNIEFYFYDDSKNLDLKKNENVKVTIYSNLYMSQIDKLKRG